MPGTSVDQLAALYVREGQDEGVRGDVAFAQSIVETGFFGFPAGGQVQAGDFNFAGIRACDSCSLRLPLCERPGGRARADPGGGYWVLYANGGVKPVDAPYLGAPSFSSDLARSIASMPDGEGDAILDAFGGIHTFGSAHALDELRGHSPIFAGDVARSIAVTPYG